MNTLLLQPNDVLFFRDGRPMGGSLAGHGAAWPLPTVTNAALHAALWRAELEGVHEHRRGRSGEYSDQRNRKFGSLVTAGPFPVDKHGRWLFPRPLDTGVTEKTELSSTAVAFLPLAGTFNPSASSLSKPLKYAAAAKLKATKVTPHAWWTREAWDAYLDGKELVAQVKSRESNGETKSTERFHEDSAFSDTESSYGIGMDPDTQTQDGKRFYSAHYLRLRPNCRLGLLAEAVDKDYRNSEGNADLVAAIFPNSGTQTPIIIGGQQRACTVERRCKDSIQLPLGKSAGFSDTKTGKFLVKWVLLSPAVFPAINGHTGGWLPSWIDNGQGQVMLKAGDTARGEREGREAWRRRVAALPPIPARLVAAIVGKAIPVTGYWLPHENAECTGAKPTHLAVPAGSVYYFECDSEQAAQTLAAALNWHGADSNPATIRNRRSTLFGEKGFGLGVCGTWTFHDGQRPG